MANVVLLYTGNVCSTPMIEYARLSRRVFVPFREHFDPHKFSKFCPDPEQQCSTLARIMAATFERDAEVYRSWPSFAQLLPDGAMPDPQAMPHTLFKWRTGFSALPGSDEIARVLKHHKADPVLMVRQSLGQQALKIQLSEIAYGGRNQQFVASDMDVSSYERYLLEQQSIRITLDALAINRVVDLARKFLHRTRLLLKNGDYYFPGNQRRAIVAEHIFRPAFDLIRYEAALNWLFAERLTLDRSAQAPIRKGGLEVSHCVNAEEVLRDARLTDLEGQYAELLAPLDILDLDFPTRR